MRYVTTNLSLIQENWGKGVSSQGRQTIYNLMYLKWVKGVTSEHKPHRYKRWTHWHYNSDTIAHGLIHLLPALQCHYIWSILCKLCHFSLCSPPVLPHTAYIPFPSPHAFPPAFFPIESSFYITLCIFLSYHSSQILCIEGLLFTSLMVESKKPKMNRTWQCKGTTLWWCCGRRIWRTWGSFKSRYDVSAPKGGKKSGW